MQQLLIFFNNENCIKMYCYFYIIFHISITSILISILLAPAADCTNNYTFHRTKYQASERGNRYLDGFVDCEAASEGNQYYMEDYDFTIGGDKMIYSCFKSDGLCFTLTLKNIGGGGWIYSVLDLAGNNNRP